MADVTHCPHENFSIGSTTGDRMTEWPMGMGNHPPRSFFRDTVPLLPRLAEPYQIV